MADLEARLEEDEADANDQSNSKSVKNSRSKKKSKSLSKKSSHKILHVFRRGNLLEMSLDEAEVQELMTSDDILIIEEVPPSMYRNLLLTFPLQETLIYPLVRTQQQKHQHMESQRRYNHWM